MVRPETVLNWHRKGGRLYWTWKSGRGWANRPWDGRTFAALQALVSSRDAHVRRAKNLFVVKCGIAVIAVRSVSLFRSSPGCSPRRLI